MNKKKNGLFLPTVLLTTLLLVVFNLDTITDYIVKLITPTPTVTIGESNEYAHNNDYKYVKKSVDFIPYSKQDIKNIFFSILNGGYENFTFYCPSEYVDCMKDVESVTQNQTMITDIGNFVHPFNNFTNIKVVTNSLGEVDVIITKMYSEDQINEINDKVEEIFNNVIKDEMDINDKILALHDYIIDNSYYDLEENENSGNAYGTLIEGKSKCAGYADSMAIMLSKLGIKNYKVASEQHVWNAVFIDNAWQHIDLTWDDPVVDSGTTITDTIRHKFYMIDTNTLHSYDTTEHTFNVAVYQELRQ